ncbi:hypothetical protein F5B21DRAFT_525523 [Xylaria acuta]|nr:hypothetical protein F5B21DRAFT_525523 [Xylaria acuta]
MLLTKSDILELSKLHGFVFPHDITSQNTGQASSQGSRIDDEGESRQSILKARIEKLLSAAINHQALWTPSPAAAFWQRIGRDSGIETAAAEDLLLRFLDARHLYHKFRESGPPLALGTFLGYWADTLYDHAKELSNELGFDNLPTTTAPIVTNLKPAIGPKEDGPVPKKRHFSEAFPTESDSSGSRFSPLTMAIRGSLPQLNKELSDLRDQIADRARQPTIQLQRNEKGWQLLAGLEDLEKDAENITKGLREECSKIIKLKRDLQEALMDLV